MHEKTIGGCLLRVGSQNAVRRPHWTEYERFFSLVEKHFHVELLVSLVFPEFWSYHYVGSTTFGSIGSKTPTPPEFRIPWEWHQDSVRCCRPYCKWQRGTIVQMEVWCLNRSTICWNYIRLQLIATAFVTNTQCFTGYGICHAKITYGNKRLCSQHLSHDSGYPNAAEGAGVDLTWVGQVAFTRNRAVRRTGSKHRVAREYRHGSAGNMVDVI